MVLYIFIIALANVCLGFAVAVHLANRYRDLIQSAPQWTPEGTGSAAGEGRGEYDASGASSAEDEEIDMTTAADLEQALAQSEQPAEEESAPADSPPPMIAGEQSIVEFQNQTQHYQEQLGSVDADLRRCSENPEKETVESCLNTLVETNQDRERVHEDFERELMSHEDMEAIRNELKAAIGQQDACIENTKAAAEEFDYEGDLGEGCRQIADQNNKLLEANDQLRETLDDARVHVARDGEGFGTEEAVAETDTLTEIPNRVALESRLSQWWSRDPHRQRQLCLAMIAVDNLAEINTTRGRKVGAAVLHVLGQIFVGERRDDAMVSRFSGDRFMYFFPDNDTRYATNVVERVRQIVEAARFQSGDTDFQASVSAAIVEATKEDTAQTLFSRAQATIKEAKRYGRNRTFLHEGEFPAPVIPPNFTLEEKSFTLS